MASVLGQPGVLGDKAEVLGVERVEAAEGHVLEAVEVVVARRRRQLETKVSRNDASMRGD